MTAPRFEGRKGLLAAMEQANRAREGGSLSEGGAHVHRAFVMISSPAARLAFDLDSEGVRTRDRYGRSRFGQSCLLARRLVEAGVPLVRVNWTRLPNMPNNGHWDTHSKNSESMRKMMPTL